MKQSVPKINFAKMKFGRLPHREDSRTMMLSKYLKMEKLPPIPKRYNWGKKIKPDNWGEMFNLQLNICTCAAAGHLIMAWTSNTGKLQRPKDFDILKAYCSVSNYNPAEPEKDEGVETLKVLKYWRKNEIAGHKIIAFAKLEDKNREQLVQTIYLFGGCYVGLNLPKSAARQYNTTKKWTIPRGGNKKDAKKGSLFGHAVLVIGYNKEELRIISWGQEMTMTMDFWEAYSEESYALFSEAFIENEKTPSGIDVAELKHDINQILNNKKSG